MAHLDLFCTNITHLAIILHLHNRRNCQTVRQNQISHIDIHSTPRLILPAQQSHISLIDIHSTPRHIVHIQTPHTWRSSSSTPAKKSSNCPKKSVSKTDVSEYHCACVCIYIHMCLCKCVCVYVRACVCDVSEYHCTCVCVCMYLSVCVYVCEKRALLCV